MKTTDRILKYVRTEPLELFEQHMQTNTNVVFFTTEEIGLYAGQSIPKSLAARWLIKEILIEHFGEVLSHQQISITSSETGKPVLHLSQPDITNPIHISISHSKNYISAMVIIELQ